MTDRAKKISELNALTSPAANSLLVIVNNPGQANAETMKVTVSNLFANSSSLIRIPGPYADDAAANAAGVSVGSVYYQASGALYVRLT